MDKENTSTAKENTSTAIESTAVYQCPICGSTMKSNREMCGICLFYRINAETNGHIRF